MTSVTKKHTHTHNRNTSGASLIYIWPQCNHEAGQ